MLTNQPLSEAEMRRREYERQHDYDRYQDIPCKCGKLMSEHKAGKGCSVFRVGLTETGD